MTSDAVAKDIIGTFGGWQNIDLQTCKPKTILTINLI